DSARGRRRSHADLPPASCCSPAAGTRTFGAWEATVREEPYDQVDYVSLHAYYEPLNGDLQTFLASGAMMEAYIEDAIATCDHVRAKLKRDKRINLSFDEWNVWYMSRHQANPPTEWRHAPRLLEDHYNVLDAVVVGSLLTALRRHADRVKMACLAQLVNVIAPTVTEPGGRVWRQTIFHPFAQAARHGRGTVLRVEPTAPYAGDVPALHATAV